MVFTLACDFASPRPATAGDGSGKVIGQLTIQIGGLIQQIAALWVTDTLAAWEA